MKKILGDIKNSLIGTYEYKISEDLEAFSYPIELDFTLYDQGQYYYPKDKNGIPVKQYKSFGLQYNPTRIAAYGLANWNNYIRNKETKNFNEFFKCVYWFASKQPKGRAEYNFDFGELTAPWVSCMAQGEAISVLTRAYYVTKESKYLDLAYEYTAPFFVSISSGGVRNKLNNGDIILEEYPFKESSHVLNGFLYAMIGIYELWEIDGKPDNRIGELFERCVETLINNIYRWNLGEGWSAYDLKNEKTNHRNWCTVSYHSLHVAQLLFIGRVSGVSSLIDLSMEWERALNNPKLRIKALRKKILYRLREPAKR